MALERTNVASSGDHPNASRAYRSPRAFSENLSMRMSNFVVREAIIPALAANTKEGVIREMIESLGRTGFLREDDLEDVIRSVLRREQLGSTGIGRCIAIPHSKAACVDRLLGTIALSPSGVAFDSIDGEPVFVFVLLVSPAEKPGDHLRALENVVRTMRDDAFVQNLREAQNAEAIWRLLETS